MSAVCFYRTQSSLTKCSRAGLRRKDNLVESITLQVLVRRVSRLNLRDKLFHLLLRHERDRTPTPAGTCDAAAVRTGGAGQLDQLVDLGARALTQLRAALVRRVHKRAECAQGIFRQLALRRLCAKADLAELEHADRFGDDVPRTLVQLEVLRFDCCGMSVQGNVGCKPDGAYHRPRRGTLRGTAPP